MHVIYLIIVHPFPQNSKKELVGVFIILNPIQTYSLCLIQIE